MADIKMGQLLHRPSNAPIDKTNPLEVKLTGNLLEYYGATEAQRPAANSVPVGATFMAVNTAEVWQSNGSSWVVLA